MHITKETMNDVLCMLRHILSLISVLGCELELDVCICMCIRVLSHCVWNVFSSILYYCVFFFFFFFISDMQIRMRPYTETFDFGKEVRDFVCKSVCLRLICICATVSPFFSCLIFSISISYILFLWWFFPLGFILFNIYIY